jgi:hypothetical protein
MFGRGVLNIQIRFGKKMDADPFHVALKDLNNPSSLQSYMANGDVDSVLFRDDVDTDKIAPGRIFRESMKRSGNDNEFSFASNAHAHALISTRLRQVIPAVTIKEDFRDTHEITWCWNLGHNLVEKGVVKRQELPIEAPITPTILDVRLQFHIHPAERPAYRKKIGAIPLLTSWTKELTQYVLNVPQPFSYSSVFHKSIKMAILNEPEIVHTYRLRNRVNELLRMRERLPDGTWRNCDREEISRKCTFSGINADGYLKAPELWGTYVMMTESEKNFFKRKTSTSYHDVAINEFLSFNPTGRNGTGMFVTIRGPYDARIMYWGALNSDGELYNNYSNYTTDPNDSKRGSDPVISSSYMREDRYEWNNLPSDHHCDGLDVPGLYLPDEPGYHAHVWGCRPGHSGLDWCVPFHTGSTLELNLGANINSCKVYTMLQTIKLQRYQADEITIISSANLPGVEFARTTTQQITQGLGQMMPFAPLPAP